MIGVVIGQATQPTVILVGLIFQNELAYPAGPTKQQVQLFLTQIEKIKFETSSNKSTFSICFIQR